MGKVTEWILGVLFQLLLMALLLFAVIGIASLVGIGLVMSWTWIFGLVGLL